MDLRPHIEKFSRRLAEVEAALSDPKADQALPTRWAMWLIVFQIPRSAFPFYCSRAR